MIKEDAEADLFSWAPYLELECNFGWGMRRYRVVALAPRISESVFEYFNERRSAWRLTRNTNVRRSLWEMGQSAGTRNGD